MEIEFEKVTTRGGDAGESGLFSGERRRKDDLYFHTLGDGDELVSALGVARGQALRDASDRRDGRSRSSTLLRRAAELEAAQRALFRVEAMVATSPRSELYESLQHITDSDVRSLEGRLAELMKKTKIGDVFIVPGDDLVAAHIDVARTICRRFERRLVACIRDRALTHLIPCQQYVNRLSDFLFVLARNIEQSSR